jgi:hypothetical protein
MFILDLSLQFERQDNFLVQVFLQPTFLSPDTTTRKSAQSCSSLPFSDVIHLHFLS